MTRWKVGTTTGIGTGTGTLTTEPDGEVVLYEDVADLERRYAEAVKLFRMTEAELHLWRQAYPCGVTMTDKVLPRVQAFLAGEDT